MGSGEVGERELIGVWFDERRNGKGFLRRGAWLDGVENPRISRFVKSDAEAIEALVRYDPTTEIVTGFEGIRAPGHDQ